MSDIVAKELRECLLVRDQYQKTSHYIKKLQEKFKNIPHSEKEVDQKTQKFLDSIKYLLESIDVSIEQDTEEFSEENLQKVENAYHEYKNYLMEAGTE